MGLCEGTDTVDSRPGPLQSCRNRYKLIRHEGEKTMRRKMSQRTIIVPITEGSSRLPDYIVQRQREENSTSTAPARNPVEVALPEREQSSVGTPK